MAFYRGQKVTPVDLPEHWSQRVAAKLFPYKSVRPEKGEVYTVANVYFAEDREAMIELIELPAPEQRHWWGYWAAGFRAAGFRPVVEPKTELPAEITAFLDPANHRNLEPVRKRVFDPSFV